MIILFMRHKSRFLESVLVMDDLKNGDTWKKSNREKGRTLQLPFSFPVVGIQYLNLDDDRVVLCFLLNVTIITVLLQRCSRQ